MNELNQIIARIRQFNEDRDWRQFHNPKDMALSLVLEAAELVEHFQWKNGEELTEYAKSNKEAIGEELADVFYWVLHMSDEFGIDILAALNRKMDKNEAKYPVEKARGSNKKYTDL
jgi:NTP pyrophosphatase (non-canonical NTP hydrolase)